MSAKHPKPDFFFDYLLEASGFFRYNSHIKESHDHILNCEF